MVRKRKQFNPTRNVDIAPRVKEGLHHQKMVADFLSRRGVECECPEVDYGDNIDKWTRKDIDIRVKGGKIIEVKSRSSTCVFTNPGDFPFDDVFVDTVAGWERKEQKPYAYVFVSQDTGAMLWVPGDTRDDWIKKHVYDSFLKYKTWTFCADRAFLRDIEELVKDLQDSDVQMDGDGQAELQGCEGETEEAA
jgi:hypothetical protein